MYFIPICDDGSFPASYEREDSTAKDLISTSYFIIAKGNRLGEYFGIDYTDLVNRVRNILMTQIFMVYQWSVLRARIEHPYKLKNLHFACSKVTPSNFVVEDSDIKLYLKNPKFLWRFSVNNYKYFYGLFTKGLKISESIGSPDNLYVDELLTYDLDHSEVVPYYITFCGSLENYIRHLLGRTTRESSRWYRMYNFTKLLENSSGYELKDYEKEEIKYSYDYILQMITLKMCYEDFVRILVTGHTLNDAGPVLKSVIEYEKLLKKQHKIKLRLPKTNEASEPIFEINSPIIDESSYLTKNANQFGQNLNNISNLVDATLKLESSTTAENMLTSKS